MLFLFIISANFLFQFLYTNLHSFNTVSNHDICTLKTHHFSFLFKKIEPSLKMTSLSVIIIVTIITILTIVVILRLDSVRNTTYQNSSQITVLDSRLTEIESIDPVNLTPINSNLTSIETYLTSTESRLVELESSGSVDLSSIEARLDALEALPFVGNLGKVEWQYTDTQSSGVIGVISPGGRTLNYTGTASQVEFLFYAQDSGALPTDVTIEILQNLIVIGTIPNLNFDTQLTTIAGTKGVAGWQSRYIANMTVNIDAAFAVFVRYTTVAVGWRRGYTALIFIV
jgi:hypothetical protein